MAKRKEEKRRKEKKREEKRRKEKKREKKKKIKKISNSWSRKISSPNSVGISPKKELLRRVLAKKKKRGGGGGGDGRSKEESQRKKRKKEKKNPNKTDKDNISPNSVGSSPLRKLSCKSLIFKAKKEKEKVREEEKENGVSECVMKRVRNGEKEKKRKINNILKLDAPATSEGIEPKRLLDPRNL